MNNNPHIHEHDCHHEHEHDHDSYHEHSSGHAGHSHAHHVPNSFNIAFAIAVILNLGFTIFEATYGVIGNSMGLLADAAHNLGDVLGLVLAWGANWLLSIPARKRYSYGYKRTSILAAVANALILVASSALIAYESIHKLFHLNDVNEHIVIAIALIGIAINGGTALLFMKGAHDDLNIKGAFLHLLSDALIAMGVVIGGVIILFTGYEWIDPIIGLLIVCSILWGTWGLLRDSLSLIMDAIPHHIDHQGVKKYLNQLPGIRAVHDLHIWGLSTKEVALTAHLVLAEGNLVDVDYKTINTVLKNQFKINHATIQIEIEGSDFLCIRSKMC
jgi:cobalt-zinc-cadmium efflux system protein